MTTASAAADLAKLRWKGTTKKQRSEHMRMMALILGKKRRKRVQERIAAAG